MMIMMMMMMMMMMILGVVVVVAAGDLSYLHFLLCYFWHVIMINELSKYVNR